MKTKKFGVSLSHKQCKVFNISWEACIDLAYDLNLKRIRIPIYWNEIAPTIDSKLIFTYIDKQLAYLSKYDFEICLQFGIKSLWWPEFYLPKIQKNHIILMKNYVQKYIKNIVKKYDNNTQIYSYQIENEPLDKSGKKQEVVEFSLLKTEIETLRNITDKKLITTSWSKIFHANYKKLMKDLNVDQVGINYYFDADRFFEKVYNFIHFHKFKYQLSTLKDYQKEKLFISELQAMPWTKLKIEDPQLEIDFYEKNIKNIINLPLEEFWFWGLEFWQYRKIFFKDMKWEKMIKNLIS